MLSTDSKSVSSGANDIGKGGLVYCVYRKENRNTL